MNYGGVNMDYHNKFNNKFKLLKPTQQPHAPTSTQNVTQNLNGNIYNFQGTLNFLKLNKNYGQPINIHGGYNIEDLYKNPKIKVFKKIKHEGMKQKKEDSNSINNNANINDMTNLSIINPQLYEKKNTINSNLVKNNFKKIEKLNLEVKERDPNIFRKKNTHTHSHTPTNIAINLTDYDNTFSENPSRLKNEETTGITGITGSTSNTKSRDRSFNMNINKSGNNKTFDDIKPQLRKNKSLIQKKQAITLINQIVNKLSKLKTILADDEESL